MQPMWLQLVQLELEQPKKIALHLFSASAVGVPSSSSKGSWECWERWRKILSMEAWERKTWFGNRKEKKKRTIFSKGPETQGPEFRSYKLDVWSFEEFECEDWPGRIRPVPPVLSQTSATTFPVLSNSLTHISYIGMFWTFKMTSFKLVGTSLDISHILNSTFPHLLGHVGHHVVDVLLHEEPCPLHQGDQKLPAWLCHNISSYIRLSFQIMIRLPKDWGEF